MTLDSFLHSIPTKVALYFCSKCGFCEGQEPQAGCCRRCGTTDDPQEAIYVREKPLSGGSAR